MRTKIKQEVFFALVRAGLWEKEVHLSSIGKVDYSIILSIAEEQTVEGIIAAGIEHITGALPPKNVILSLIGKTLQLEQLNIAMNQFISDIIVKMNNSNISCLLVKGQGIAQCYERPLWRSSGDVDLLLNESNYAKAKKVLSPIASSIEKESVYEKQLGMTIGQWVLELHGSLHCGLSCKLDRKLDELFIETFSNSKPRIWKNGEVAVLLPNIDNDIIIVFTHIIKHFYLGGVGLRQLCDLCRLLWVYKNDINVELLQNRLTVLGLLTEWRSFAAFFVDYLDMPSIAMPLYDSSKRYKNKSRKIREFVLTCGNFGKKRDLSYYSTTPYLIRKCISFIQRIKDIVRHGLIFPCNSIRYVPSIVYNGVRSVFNGE